VRANSVMTTSKILLLTTTLVAWFHWLARARFRMISSLFRRRHSIVSAEPVAQGCRTRWSRQAGVRFND
jgi:hypothetical protein